MEILSCSLLVCRAWSAQFYWRSGARARCCFLPLFSPCVVHVRTSVDVHLDSYDRTQAVSFKTVISTAPSSTFLKKRLKQLRLHSKYLFRSRYMCLWYLSSLWEILTQVWTLGVGSDRSLARPKEWNGEPSGFDDFAFTFSNRLRAFVRCREFPGGVSDHGSADSVGNAYTTREGRGQRSRDCTAGSDRWKGFELHPTSP